MVLQTSQEKLHLRGELKLVHLQETILLEFYVNYWFFAVSFNPEMNMSKKLKKNPNKTTTTTAKHQKTNQTKPKHKQKCGSLAGRTSSSASLLRGKKKNYFRPMICLSLVPKEKTALRRVSVLQLGVGSVFLVGWFVLVLIAVIPALKGQHALWNMYLVAHN